jgi:hypothetical protein
MLWISLWMQFLFVTVAHKYSYPNSARFYKYVYKGWLLSNKSSRRWRFSAPIHTKSAPTQPPIQCVLGLFPRVNMSRAWRWLPIPSSAKVKERVQLCLYLPCRFSLPVLGWTFTLLLLPMHMASASPTQNLNAVAGTLCNISCNTDLL